MEKLQMCRICLVENVRMNVVVNRNLHELYEKLTDIPFVTEDRRPILACFFCCTKLKQCCRLLRKCLEAEEQFAQMMNEDYEPNPLINHDRLDFYSGFIKSPIEHISIVDECQTENIAIKEELPAVCEGLDDIIEPNEEHESDELEPENLDYNCLDVADVPPHFSESDLGYDVPIIDFKTEVEEEVSLDNSCLDVADIPPHYSLSDLGYDVPLIEFNTEVEEEVSMKKRTATETKRATVVKKPKLEDAITAGETKTENLDSKVIRPSQKRTSKPGTSYKERENKCDQSSFNQNSHLTNHIGIHTGEKPYKCDVCQRRFSRNNDLSKHTRIHTGEKPSFNQNSHLANHIGIHTGEKPYKCDVCQRRFSRNNDLTKHTRIHTGEKPFKCNICERSFSENSTLKNHIRIHSGEKPFECDVCQRSFSQNSDLTKHIRIHTGEKPYKCDVCQRCFIQKGSLTNHIRIHTGERPYKCEICERNFNQKSHLTKHIRIHDGEKPWERENIRQAIE